MTCVADPNCPLMKECEEFLESKPIFGNDLKYDPFHVILYDMITKVWDEYHPGMKCQEVIEDDC
jgi:hypothetical protein